MDKFFAAILPAIEHIHLLGYAAAFLVALLETVIVVGLFLPGSTLLLLLGALAAHGALDFAYLLGFAVAGVVAGDNVNYWLGQRYGHQWRRDGVWRLTSTHFAQARRFFDRHGAKSVFLARFIPSMKEIAPLVAGTVGMRHRSFMLWNVLGAIGWGLQWIGAGYVFGHSLKLAQVWMSRAGIALVAVLLAVWLLWLLQRHALRQGRRLWRLLVSLSHSLSAGLASNPYVRQWLRRHPRSVRFVAGRLDRSHFFGLPLTLLGLAFAYALALFAGVVEDVLTSDTIVALDHATAQLIARYRPSAFIAPVAWLTNLGAPAVVGAVTSATCVLLYVLGRRFAAAGLLLSTLGASLFTMLGKLAFQRPRPDEAVLFEPTHSFPSGHAVLSVAVYGFVGYLLIRMASDWNTRVRLFFATTGFVLLLGLSRVVLGVHYLSDVWAGYLVGTLWLIVGISVNEWLAARGRIAWHAPSARLPKAMAAGLMAVVVAGGVGYALTRPLAVRTPAAATPVQVDRALPALLQADALRATTTMLGRPEQPLSFVIVARNEHELSALLRQAGWIAADSPTPRSLLRLAREGLGYTTAPQAPTLWNDHLNDFAFQQPLQQAAGSALAALRIWRTAFRLGQDEVFVGVAREYTGVRWGIVHMVAPDVDAATERFVRTLESMDPTLRTCRRSFIPALIGTYSMGGRFFTAGQLWLLDAGTGSDAARPCDTGSPSQ